ncbi:MAG: PIN domain-containing protein [Chromatiaceae bacterium]|nr:PIN domain-containing protein [Chromatiaceae bacterium]
MRALLDVNVLIALLDASHAHHDVAMGWLEREQANGWASCPITQNGCIRIMSQPAYPAPLPAGAVAERLAEAVAGPEHHFWHDDLNPVADKSLTWDRILGHRQVTDAYLLALAVKHGGRFVTFDSRVGLRTVRGAKEAHLTVIA